MPTTVNPTQASPGRNGVLQQEFLPGKGFHLALQGAVQQPLAQPNGTPTVPASTTDPFSGIISLTFPAQGSGTNATVTGEVNVTTWPQVFTLNNRTAHISVSTSLASLPTSLLLGHPYVVLTFGRGSPFTGPGQGTSTYFLPAGGTYASPSISLSAQAFYLAATGGPTVVQFSVNALLMFFSTTAP